MKNLAIIQASGRQHLVSEGDVLTLHEIKKNVGETVEWTAPLFFADASRQDVRIGAPFIEGCVVRGTVLSGQKGKKMSVVKYKPKVRYRRRVGHRQIETKVRIDVIAT